MTSQYDRLHVQVAGATPFELGQDRGEQLRTRLPEAYRRYAELFRTVGVTEKQEREGAEATLESMAAWHPASAEELRGVAEGSGLDLLQVAALNARTEILALGSRGSKECSTIAAKVEGRMRAVQTWDWHIELDDCWHTHAVAGPGYRFAGLTEQGIISKIGINERGLALHFNILGHADDRPGGVPMHVLSAAVLAECATVAEAVALVRDAPVTSSSSFTLVDPAGAVSLEITPIGVFEAHAVNEAVVRTNHFQDAAPLAGQRTQLYEPDSTERFDLIRERLAEGSPKNAEALVKLLESAEGEAPLSCVPDMSLAFGDRWATLATIVTDPEARTLSVLDGMPTEVHQKTWRTLSATQ